MTSEFDPFFGYPPLLAIAYLVRFLLELALFAGAAVIAWNLTSGWWRWLASILAVAAGLTVWSLFISPKATFVLPWLAAFGIEAALFVGIGVGLFLLGFRVPAIILASVWILDSIAIAILDK